MEVINIEQSSIVGTAYQNANIAPTGDIKSLFNIAIRGIGSSPWAWASMKNSSTITK